MPLVQCCRADSVRKKRAQKKKCGRGNSLTNVCAVVAWKQRFQPNCRAWVEMRKKYRKSLLAQCFEDLVTT